MTSQLKVMKWFRVSASVIKRIERVAQWERSNFSEFVRTAAVNELKRKERQLRKMVAA